MVLSKVLDRSLVLQLESLPTNGAFAPLSVKGGFSDLGLADLPREGRENDE